MIYFKFLSKTILFIIFMISIVNSDVIKQEKLLSNSYFIKLGLFSNDSSINRLKNIFSKDQLYIQVNNNGLKAIYLANFLDKSSAQVKLKDVKKVVKDAYILHITAKEIIKEDHSFQKVVQNTDQDIKSKKDIELEMLKSENKKQKKLIEKLTYRVDDLEDHVDDVETSTLVDKLNFSLGIRNRVDNFTRVYTDGRKKSSNGMASMKVMFNTKAKIANNIKFQGRLSMYKYWADSTRHMYSSFDNMQGRVPADSGLYVERAYLDWLLNQNGYIPTVLTIGRQPSSDGPSHQFKNNTKRKSTYSALVFDGASDGAVLSFNFDKLGLVDNSRLRFAYGKGFQNDETRSDIQNAFIGADNLLKDTVVYGTFFESSIFNVDKTLFQIGFVNMKDIIANSLDIDVSKNINLGDLFFAGVMFEATNLNDSNFDLFCHFAYSKATPNGNSYKFNGRDYGLLSNENGVNEKNGNAIWLGGRYTFTALASSKIGLEYNHGSKNWMTVSQGSYDLVNKLATRGDAYEAYYIYPINKYSFVKLGAMYVDYKYTGSGWYLGSPTDISTLSSLKQSEVIDSLRNISLELSVNY